MPNIYQHIDKNKRDTVFVFITFSLVIGALGWFLGEYFDSGSGTGFFGLALIVSGISGFVSYYNSDKIVLSISHARPLDSREFPDVMHLVENMSIASGIPVPRVYVIDDTAMNAFATGRDPEHAVICLTTGIIARLEKRELEGVIAHEMAHIGNFDTRLMSIVSILVGTVVLISDMFTRGRLYRLGGSGRRGKGSEASGIILLIGLFFMILSPIIAKLIQLSIGRTREYLADSTAALITRYPQGLANALRKISGDVEILEAANGATEPLYICSPLRSSQETMLSRLFDTHPPVEDRIKRLETM